jgi:hypothetical protein
VAPSWKKVSRFNGMDDEKRFARWQSDHGDDFFMPQPSFASIEFLILSFIEWATILHRPVFGDGMFDYSEMV